MNCSSSVNLSRSLNDLSVQSTQLNRPVMIVQADKQTEKVTEKMLRPLLSPNLCVSFSHLRLVRLRRLVGQDDLSVFSVESGSYKWVSGTTWFHIQVQQFCLYYLKSNYAACDWRHLPLRLFLKTIR